MKPKVHIYIPSGKSVYYANFRVKRRHATQGTQTIHVNRSTGSADRRVAQSIANHMRDQELLGYFVPKLREDFPTVGDLVDRWLERSKLRTAKSVSMEFLSVVAEGAGILDPAKRDDARGLRVTVLTKAAMLAFRDRPDQGRTATTINKMMRSARSMFSRRAMEYYEGLKLPDLAGWRGVAFLQDRHDTTFRRIPQAVLDKMDRQATAMLRLARRHRDPHRRHRWQNAWAAYQLMRRCGLRNSEVEEIRWDWFRREGDRILLDLVPRDYWRPKASAGSVPVAPDLYAQLVQAFGPPRPGPDGYLLQGTPAARWSGTHREVNEFMRRHLPDGEKAAYQLRKQYGSEMARRHGLETAAKLLRHRGLATAWQHYFDDLKLSTVEAL